MYARLARSLPAQPSLCSHRVYSDPKSREVWAYLCCRRPARYSLITDSLWAEGTKHTHTAHRRPSPLPFPRPEHKWSSSCLRDVWELSPRVLSMSELCLPFPGNQGASMGLGDPNLALSTPARARPLHTKCLGAHGRDAGCRSAPSSLLNSPQEKHPLIEASINNFISRWNDEHYISSSKDRCHLKMKSLCVCVCFL